MYNVRRVRGGAKFLGFTVKSHHLYVKNMSGNFEFYPFSQHNLILSTSQMENEILSSYPTQN